MEIKKIDDIAEYLATVGKGPKKKETRNNFEYDAVKNFKKVIEVIAKDIIETKEYINHIYEQLLENEAFKEYEFSENLTKSSKSE